MKNSTELSDIQSQTIGKYHLHTAVDEIIIPTLTVLRWSLVMTNNSNDSLLFNIRISIKLSDFLSIYIEISEL